LLNLAVKDVASVTEPSLRLDARFAIAQTQRTMGLPNDLAEVNRQRDAQVGVLPTPPRATGPTVSASSSAMELVGAADGLRNQGDLAGAKKLLRRVKPGSDPSGTWIILAGQIQAELGDREPAQANLAAGSRIFLARLQPIIAGPGEEMMQLNSLANAQILANDRSGARQTLITAIRKLAGPDRYVKVAQMGDRTGSVMHDRQSPTLHAGVVLLAKAGFTSDAIAMARSIPAPAHRAIALAAVVRDGKG